MPPKAKAKKSDKDKDKKVGFAGFSPGGIAPLPTDAGPGPASA